MASLLSISRPKPQLSAERWLSKANVFSTCTDGLIEQCDVDQPPWMVMDCFWWFSYVYRALNETWLLTSVYELSIRSFKTCRLWDNYVISVLVDGGNRTYCGEINIPRHFEWEVYWCFDWLTNGLFVRMGGGDIIRISDVVCCWKTFLSHLEHVFSNNFRQKKK